MIFPDFFSVFFLLCFVCFFLRLVVWCPWLLSLTVKPRPEENALEWGKPKTVSIQEAAQISPDISSRGDVHSTVRVLTVFFCQIFGEIHALC